MSYQNKAAALIWQQWHGWNGHIPNLHVLCVAYKPFPSHVFFEGVCVVYGCVWMPVCHACIVCVFEQKKNGIMSHITNLHALCIAYKPLSSHAFFKGVYVVEYMYVMHVLCVYLNKKKMVLD